MKILILGSGLGAIYRGYERFAVEMGDHLRASGLQVSCWGNSNERGVLRVPILDREELHHLALERMREDPRLSGLSGWELHDWTLHTEDQLFGIAAAALLKQEISKDNPLVVYLKWQGGLIDSGGASTVLYELLAQGAREGTVRTIIHTDWVYPPVITRLAGAGFIFHCVVPWLAEMVRALGVPAEKIFHLPMGTISAPFKNVQLKRESLRKVLNIPHDAFVAVSVGAFYKEGKNFPFVLRDLSPLAADKDFYWLVAGARGNEESAWEKEARSLFGERFIAQVNVPFERMPEIYGLADLALCGSVNETFGLCYVEPQLADVPCVMHDCQVTQWISSNLPAELAPISRVDMRSKGAALAAVKQWRNLLANPEHKKTLAGIIQRFRSVQDEKFAWEKLRPRFAEVFGNVGQIRHDTSAYANSSTAGTKTSRIPPAQTKPAKVSRKLTEKAYRMRQIFRKVLINA